MIYRDFVRHHVDSVLHEMDEAATVFYEVMPLYVQVIDNLYAPGERRAFITGDATTTVVFWKAMPEDLRTEDARENYVWSFPSERGPATGEEIEAMTRSAVDAINDMIFARKRAHAKSTHYVFDVDNKTGQELDDFVGLFGVSRLPKGETDYDLRQRFKHICGDG